MNKESEELRPEYDFSAGVRGKYAKQFAAGTNLVLLDVDVARAFPNADAASSDVTLCFSMFTMALAGSHSKSSIALPQAA